MIWLYRNRDRRVFEFGRRPGNLLTHSLTHSSTHSLTYLLTLSVLQYFVLSYLFGLFGIIAWIGFVGGLKTRSQAGV